MRERRGLSIYSGGKTEFWVWEVLILYMIAPLAMEIGSLNFLGGEESPLVKNSPLLVLNLLLLLDAFDDWPVNVFICFMWGDNKDIFVKMWLVACLLFSPQTYFLECLVESKILKISRTWRKGLREYLFISIFISYLLSPDSTIFSLSKMFSLTFSQKLNNEWTDE